MFDMMGQLMLLARGKVIYFNEASRAVDYFASIDYRVPELCNPADYFMQIMSIESIEQAREDEIGQSRMSSHQNFAIPEHQKTVAEEYKERIDFFKQKYDTSPLANDADACECNGEYPEISSELL